MFHVVTTLHENGGTLNVMVRFEDTFVFFCNSPSSFLNYRMEVSKLQLEY
jgi:hypothetical protein